MRKLMKMFLFLLSFSLILQNTCPYGFAAKTAFAAPHTHACPFHHCPPKKQNAVDDNANKAMYPTFVMAVPFVQPSIQRFPISTGYVLFSSDRYTNPFKEPLIKPPVT
jgi:hypothetical protein